jgi:hypothetical protein
MNSPSFSLHAAMRAGQGDRSQLEKLCRYVMLSAIYLKRLEVCAGGLISVVTDPASVGKVLEDIKLAAEKRRRRRAFRNGDRERGP